ARSAPPANTSSTSARSRSLGVTLFDTGVGSFLVTWSSSRETYVRPHLHRSCDATGEQWCLGNLGEHERARNLDEDAPTPRASASNSPPTCPIWVSTNAPVKLKSGSSANAE
ncbi:MAG: hypothetical protein ABR608_11000, partial [Pseudonocardiaceae bacterium]